MTPAELETLAEALAHEPGPDGLPTAETLRWLQFRDAAGGLRPATCGLPGTQPGTRPQDSDAIRWGSGMASDLEAEREACHVLADACYDRGEELRANAWLSVGVAIAHLIQAHKAGNCPACLAGIKRRSFIFDLLFAGGIDSKPGPAGQKKALLDLMAGGK